MLAALADWQERTLDIRDLRQKEGRALSATRRRRIQDVHDGLRQMTELIAELLTETDPGGPARASRRRPAAALRPGPGESRPEPNGVTL